MYRSPYRAHDKTKANNMLVSLLIVSDFSVAPSLFVPTEDLKQRHVNVLEKDSWTLVEYPTQVARGSSGGANRGQCPRNSESGPPCGPPDRESALITQ